MPGNGNPPGNLEERIEPMLDSTALGCFYFEARLFSVEAIEDTHNQGKAKSPGEVTCG